MPKNSELSEGDKKFAASMYPPRVASLDGAPSQSERMGLPSVKPQDPQKVEGDYRAELQRSFEALLAQSGVTDSDANELAAKFQQELAKLRRGPGGRAN